MKTEPTYIKIANDIKENIKLHKEIGDKLSSESEFCKKYAVSKLTIRHALDILLEENIIYKKQGQGSFVKNKEYLAESFSFNYDDTFSLNAKKHHLKYHNKVTLFKVIKANNQIAKKLNIKVNDKVFHLTRVRYLEEEPSMLEDLYIVHALFPNLTEKSLQKSSNSIFKYVQQYHKITQTKRQLSPVLVDIPIAKELHFNPNEPTFKANVTNYIMNNTVFEYSIIYYNPNKYTFEHSTKFR